MNPESAVSVTLGLDPVWPWSVRPPWGLAAFGLAAALLLAGSAFTYLSALRAGRLRAISLVALRLLALLVALLVALRPALGFREEHKLPSTLLVLLDSSESMTVRDEAGGRSRWDELKRLLREAEPAVAQLRDTQNLTVVFRRFDKELADFTPNDAAAGKQSWYGPALAGLFERQGSSEGVRGVLVVGDGADNGSGNPAQSEAARWKAAGVPVHTFVLGRETTDTEQRDLAVAALAADPTVPVKNALAIRATLDGPGFVGARVRPKVFLDDKEVTELFKDRDLRQPFDPVLLDRPTGNAAVVYVRAPETPGEVKLTLKLDPQRGEGSVVNNEVSTYVTVTKEGVRVLLVDNARPEMTAIGDALRQDRRVQLDRVVIQTAGADAADLFRLDKQAYDVILLGDVAPDALLAGRPDLAAQLEGLVRVKGAGLLMYGGYRSLGGDGTEGTGWQGVRSVADLLPVGLVPGQIDPENGVIVRPTPKGLSHFVMRLAATDAESEELWKKLPRLTGMNKLGAPKVGAEVLALGAERTDQKDAPPLLVWQQYGKGRTMAFAGDTTLNWFGLNWPSNDGVALHSKFWRKMVVFLAQQENAGGNVGVLLDARRLSAGSRQGMTLSLRGKEGADLADARFEVTVTGPDKTATPVPVTKEKDGSRRASYWKTDRAGEYFVRVRAKGTDADGSPVESEGQARFLVYQDDTEMLRPAAQPEYLARLAAAGGGQALRGDDLPRFLRELQTQGQPLNRVKVTHWPEWRRGPLSGVMPAILAVFAVLLTLEWALRRSWGLA